MPQPPAHAAPILLASPADIFFRRLFRGWISLILGGPASLILGVSLIRWWNDPPRAYGAGFVLALLFFGTASTWVRTLWSAVRRSQIAWVGRRTEATVVAISSDQKVKINGKHPKVLKYLFVLPASGEKIKSVSPHLTGKEPRAWQVGDKLIAAYLPAQPTETVILSSPPRREPPR